MHAKIKEEKVEGRRVKIIRRFREKLWGTRAPWMWQMADFGDGHVETMTLHGGVQI